MLLPLQDSRKSQGNTFFEEIRFGATTSTIFVRYLQKSITINRFWAWPYHQKNSLGMMYIKVTLYKLLNKGSIIYQSSINVFLIESYFSFFPFIYSSYIFISLCLLLFIYLFFFSIFFLILCKTLKLIFWINCLL